MAEQLSLVERLRKLNYLSDPFYDFQALITEAAEYIAALEAQAEQKNQNQVAASSALRNEPNGLSDTARLNWLEQHARIVMWPADTLAYPVEHSMSANKFNPSGGLRADIDALLAESDSPVQIAADGHSDAKKDSLAANVTLPNELLGLSKEPNNG
jgi:hypothetical protein